MEQQLDFDGWSDNWRGAKLSCIQIEPYLVSHFFLEPRILISCLLFNLSKRLPSVESQIFYVSPDSFMYSEAMRKHYQRKIKQFRNIVRLANGEISPKTAAQEQFLEVAIGARQPSTDWELMYLAWLKQDKISIEEFFIAGLALDAVVAHSLSNFKQAPKAVKGKSSTTKKVMSVSDAKKLDKPRRSQAEIDRVHRKSGYYNQITSVVQGGKVNPR